MSCQFTIKLTLYLRGILVAVYIFRARASLHHVLYVSSNLWPNKFNIRILLLLNFVTCQCCCCCLADCKLCETFASLLCDRVKCILPDNICSSFHGPWSHHTMYLIFHAEKYMLPLWHCTLHVHVFFLLDPIANHSPEKRPVIQLFVCFGIKTNCLISEDKLLYSSWISVWWSHITCKIQNLQLAE